MSKIGLFYGSNTGKTESAAEMIQAEFGGSSVVTLHEIADASDSDFDSRVLAHCCWVQKLSN